MKIEIEIKNLAEIKEAFKVAPEKMRKEIAEAINKSALLIERESKFLTPVKTGRLRASILSVIQPFEATVAPHTEYALIVHNRIPYMTGGATMADKKIQEVFKQAVDNALVNLK